MNRSVRIDARVAQRKGARPGAPASRALGHDKPWTIRQPVMFDMYTTPVVTVGVPGGRSTTKIDQKRSAEAVRPRSSDRRTAW
ncbi:hypothetical protein [Streptacidiphilus pinicola]|uniref:hypothetical protein n=1 Tax=Streptacidiphilus pinicola TaxID=2219663 RepID=UPI001057C2B1|nr:hypothetical protein [Streptacidiphilus pinicola]